VKVAMRSAKLFDLFGERRYRCALLSALPAIPLGMAVEIEVTLELKD
jgi:hypothetical protein